MNLECTVCTFHFNEDINCPKVLICGHTICKSCTLSSAIRHKCPICRNVMKMDDLPTNYTLLDIIRHQNLINSDETLNNLKICVKKSKNIVDYLYEMLPKVMKGFNKILSSSNAKLLDMEEKLKNYQENGIGASEVVKQDLQFLSEIELLLKLNLCSQSVSTHDNQHFRFDFQDDLTLEAIKILLLQVKNDGQLKKV